MKLALRFGVIYVVALAVVLVVVSALANTYLQRVARQQVLHQAQLMMQAALAMRDYTTDQIKPIRSLRTASEFHPQWIPAYAAGQIFGYLRGKYPEYTYREAALNPTNKRDAAVDWEADIINAFRNNANLHELSGERNTPTGRSMYLAHPIAAAGSCLECHSTPAAAPPKMIAQYGGDNGFGWRLNEVVAAQIVSVPFSAATDLANNALRALITALLVMALVALIGFWAILRFLVLPRAQQQQSAAHRESGSAPAP
jgi:protein-histidine pros-kinase